MFLTAVKLLQIHSYPAPVTTPSHWKQDHFLTREHGLGQRRGRRRDSSRRRVCDS